MFSPLGRSALAVARIEAQSKRRVLRTSRWRELNKLVSLSAWQESAIVQSVVSMFRMSAEATRWLRASSGSQFEGAGYRQLRMENLEVRQMLSVNMGALCTGNDNVVSNVGITSSATSFIDTPPTTRGFHPFALDVTVPTTPDLDTSSDTGTSTTDDKTNDTTPTFNGISDPNSHVHVGTWVDGNANTVIEDSEVSNIVDDVISDGSGNYSATFGTLADGNYQIVAKAYDELGNPSEGANNGWSNPLNIVVDTNIAATTVDLAAESDSISPSTDLPGTNSDDLTNIKIPVFQGSAEPGATVAVFDGANPTPIATATANETGNWVTTPLAVALTDGFHSITTTATDVFGNTSTSVPLLVTIDSIISVNTAPDMSAATDSGSSSSDNITNVNMPTFTGMTENDAPLNAYVELLLDGTTVIATGNASSGVWTLTPAGAIAGGTHSVEARVTDHTGNISTSSPITIVIDTVSPSAVNDTASTNEDSPKTLNVVDNDTDTTDSSLTVVGVTNGSNGTVVNNDDGTVTYTPNLNFSGTDTFTYMVRDDAGNSTTANVNITVNPLNDAPDAVGDTASTNEDTSVTTVNVLANDSDVDNTLVPASIIAFTQGTNGTVVSNGDGTFTYTPDANFNGADSFTYTISDGTASDTATVAITVTAVNDAPAASNDTASTNEDTLVAVNVLANDNAGPSNELQSLSVTATTNGVHGTVTTNGTTVTYTPSSNFNGTDSFTYTIIDNGGLTATATVNITVNAVNDAPVAVNDTASTNEDTPVTVTVLTNDNGGPSNEVQAVTVTTTTNGTHGTVMTNGTTVTYTPTLNFHGNDTFTYTITDDGGLTSTATVNITVNPSVVITGASSANDGQTVTYSFTTTDPVAVNTYSRTITSSNPLDIVTPVLFDSTTGSGTFKVKFHGPIGTSTSILTVNVSEEGGPLTGSGTLAVTVKSTFRVTGIVVNDSGFDFTFNNAIDLTNLNLYDGINPLLPGDTIKLPDVVVHGAISNVDMKGSVVWNAATNTLSWVKSGGVMGADTYFVKLISGGNAFKDISGNLLDGNADFVAGGDYQQSVPISPLGGTPIVGLPDFARGPGQSVDLTASNTLDTTLPVRATGVNVQGVDFKLVYDTTLLTIDLDQVTAALSNWSVAASQSLVGTIATLIVSASANLPSAAFTGTTAFVNIMATVPSAAPYGATQVLRLIDCEVNEVNAQDDIAIQKVAFPGDANGSGIVPSSSPPSPYTAEDASLIARVIVGAAGTTGFDAYPLVDPAIVGDASGNGGASLSAFDTSLVAQESAGINTPEVPDVSGSGSGGFAQYDPQLSIPDNMFVLTGHSYELPVNVTIETSAVGIISSTYTVKYDTGDLDFLGATNGSDFAAPGWTMTVNEQVPGTIKVSIFNTFPSGNNGGAPLQLGKLNFFVLHSADVGTSPLQIDPVDPHESGLAWTKDDGFVQITRLQGDYNFDNSVDAIDYVLWRNTVGTSVPKHSSTDGNGDAEVNGIDYTIWRGNFGASVPGAGAGTGLAADSLSDDPPVSPLNSTEALPNSARDEVMAGFALGASSADSRTTRIVRIRLQENSRLSEANLLCAVTNQKRQHTADEYDSLIDHNSNDRTDAVEELFSDLDCELISLK